MSFKLEFGLINNLILFFSFIFFPTFRRKKHRFSQQSQIDNCIFIFFHLMPIGVPKVPFLLPGDDDASWIDLYNLFKKNKASAFTLLLEFSER